MTETRTHRLYEQANRNLRLHLNNDLCSYLRVEPGRFIIEWSHPVRNTTRDVEVVTDPEKLDINDEVIVIGPTVSDLSSDEPIKSTTNDKIVTELSSGDPVVTYHLTDDGWRVDDVLYANGRHLTPEKTVTVLKIKSTQFHPHDE